jgi:hypothetical protein
LLSRLLAMRSTGSALILLTIASSFSCNCSRLPGTVGRTTGRALGVERDFLRFREEVQSHVQLAGQQVATARLGTQAVIDEGAQQADAGGFVVGVVLEFGEHLFVGLTETLRVNDNADVKREGAFFRIEIQVDAHDPADFHTEKLDGCIDLESAQ